MGRSHKGPTLPETAKMPRMRPTRKDPVHTWKRNRGSGGNAGSQGTVAAASKSPHKRLPKLSRDGDGLRNHFIPREELVKDLIHSEVEGRSIEVAEDPGPAAVVEFNGQEREIDPDVFRGKGRLSLEEKTFILEARFSKGWKDRRIAEAIKRPRKIVSEFIARYSSTNTLAKQHFNREAEALARRITKKANVDQAMEIMDRLDILPVKQRNKDAAAAQFNIIVGMPGQAVTSSSVPDQKTIEAAKVK